MKREEDVILIAGPTASGKTSLAIKTAQASDAVVINADSMQVYRDLRVITARPSKEEEAQAQHFGFGTIDACESYSVAQWLADLKGMLATSKLKGKRIVLVGGTGLYFNALLNGLSPIPSIAPEIREKWRRLSDENSTMLHDELILRDRKMADQLEPGDLQRIVRALEVVDSTGYSLLDWQREKGQPFFEPTTRIAKYLLLPERSLLHERINQRFDMMVGQGALEEVAALKARNLDSELPAMKAIGVPQLGSHLVGNLSLEDAIEQAKAATRQYAKRQMTWFRNSFDGDWAQIRS